MKGKDLKGVKKMPIGGLDSDTSLQLVAVEDYVEAKNLQNINKEDSNEDIDTQALKGNIVGFQIDDLAAQPKIISLLLTNEDLPTNPDFTAGNITTIRVLTQNGYQISSTTLDTTMADVAAYAAAIQASMIAAGQASATATVETFTSGNYTYAIAIQIDNAIPYEDFLVVSDAAAPNNVIFDSTIKQESINQLLAGKIECIGSDNIEQDLFLYGTTVRTKDFAEIAIQAVTNVINVPTNSIVNIQTTSAHGLTTGDSILVSDNGGLSDGIWQVFVVDTTNIYLYNSSYGVYSAGSGGVLQKYIEGYGSLYYANRDKYSQWKETPSSTTSKAIRLVGAKGLNMITTHQVDSVAIKNNYQTKFKFTDNYNKPKMLLYKESEYKEDGFIYYPDYANNAIYNYNSIYQQSNLINGVESLNIDVSEVIGGGNVTTKNYAFCVALSNDDNSTSNWSFQSPVISIISQDTTDNTPSNIIAFGGDLSAEATTKSILLDITGIPVSTYKYIEIAVISYVDGSLSSVKKTNKIPLSLSSDSFSFTYTGDLTDFVDISFVELQQISLLVKTALNIVDIENRTAISNVTFDIDPDLTAMSSAITIVVKQKQIQKKGTLSDPIPLLFGEYELVENIINNVGYHLMDTVPLGISYKMKNGGWTRSYHIDNVNIMAGLLANGYDFSLSAALGSSYVYCFEISNIDFDYLVNGIPLRDLIDDVKITRGDINSEVIASGIFIVADKPLTNNQPQYTGAAIGGTSNRNAGFFYSPDFNNSAAQAYTRVDGDKIIILGSSFLENSYVGSFGSGTVEEFDGQLSNLHQELSIDSAISFFPNNINVTTFPASLETASLLDANLPNFWAACYGLLIDSGGGGALSLTGNTDLGVYNAIIIRPQAQLYPDDTSLITYKPINGITFDIDNDTTSTLYFAYGGDTFTMKKYIKARRDDTSIDALAIGYYSQSKQNTQLSKGVFPRCGASAAPISVGAAVLTYLLTIIEYTTERYDRSFNILNLIDAIVGYSSLVADQASSKATVYWSQQALTDSAQNNDRIFLPADNRALDLSYGEIIHMIVANDVLYTLQPNKTERQYFDNTNQLTSATNSTILLGTGNVMGTKGDFKSTFGCVHKWGVVKGKTDGGRDLFIYPDALRKKIIRVGEDGTVVISDRWNMANWSLKNLKYTWNHTTPAENYGIHGVYDNKNKSFILTSRCYRKEDYTWEVGGRYFIGQYVLNDKYYGFEGQPILFLCTSNNIAASNTEPLVGASWRTVWEQVEQDSELYNWWSIVISEKENKFKWLQTPKPKIWFQYQETILSPNPLKALTSSYDNTKNQIFEFTETNDQCEWYCHEPTTNIYGVTSGITLNIYQLPFPDTTPYSLYNILPDISLWGDMEVSVFDGTTYARIIDLNIAGTVATLENELSAVVKVFKLRICNSEDAYLTNVVNENNGTKVKFVAIQYNSLLAPYRLDMYTNNLQTFLANGDFTPVDEYFSAAIPFDTTNNPTDNQADTSMIFGKYLKIKTTLKRRILQKINNFVVTMREVNRKM